MEQWEYLTEFVWARLEAQGVREFLQRKWPNWQDPPKFTPEAMMPALNVRGAEGWELVHMQPVAKVGDNGDVFFGGGGGYNYSNVYFCVFKRRVP